MTRDQVLKLYALINKLKDENERLRSELEKLLAHFETVQTLSEK